MRKIKEKERGERNKREREREILRSGMRMIRGFVSIP